MAWEEAPLSKLSRQETMTSFLPSGESWKPMSQKEVRTTCWICGRSGERRTRTMGLAT